VTPSVTAPGDTHPSDATVPHDEIDDYNDEQKRGQYASLSNS